MKTVRLVCGNVDSCADGTTHKFPDIGEQVTVWSTCELRVVGGGARRNQPEEWVDWRPGEIGVVEEFFPEAHEVIASIHGVRLWLCIDDIDGLVNNTPEEVNDVPCPRCKAQANSGCVTPSGNPANEPHTARVTRFWKEQS